ncbi:pseudouridine synthase [Heyndrickxia ginsengihumi]|uniref:Pseudouridine synthase n=1 Tax=Heyndrickxia ginsengihumi TaxID=363870 RepID=A0A0A6VEI4_9BACI|nr:RluA family pseudouridine synthase [Heyndrickxia ginsengihumi]KHD85873.1 pseudouridine synthase [Heyndrickxia ginsengihumi]
MKAKRNGNLFEFELPNKLNGMTIETILKEHWSTPKKMLHQFRMDKAVQINGENLSWNKPLKAHDLFSIAIFKEEDFGVVPEYHPVEILYEDEHLLVANKPAGMDTHPNVEGQTNTLANAIAFHYQQNGEACRVRHVHRLDHDTTGAVLFAKHAWGHAILDHLLNKREIKRTYWALVHGTPHPLSGVITQPIGRDRHHPTRRRVSKTGQAAKTNYAVKQQFHKQQLSLVECTLDTGRTHQIRVHMSSIGHPIAGDTLYGGKTIFQRQALHARKLNLIHPFTENAIECIAPFHDEPAIFEDYVKQIQ